MKFLRALLLVAFSSTLLSANAKSITSLKTESMQIDISDKGLITSIIDLNSKKNYLPKDANAPLLALRVDNKYLNPESATWDKNKSIITLSYPGKITASIKVVANKNYHTLEVAQIKNPSQANIEIALWGSYPTTISRTVGECVGVVRDSVFAFGLRSLNTKTLGGYPSSEDDVDPAFDIFATNSLQDISSDMKVLYRGQTARHTKTGSEIHAYTRNRDKDRVIAMWGHEKYTAPALNDGGILGSKIALFGCPEPRTLDVLEEIVVGEGMPYPKIDGVWSKRNPDASQAYIIYPFNETNIEQAIEFTKRTGLKYLYHAGPFLTWGKFELNPKEFPHGIDGLRTCVEKAAAHGIKLGVHTLSNFTSTSDKYVTPVPDPRLAKVGSSTLSSAIDETQKEIVIESPDFFNQMANNSLHTVLVNQELIRYEKVSSTAPWTLLGCQRGAWGTKASPHKTGDQIGKLLDHPYNVFLTNTDLTKEEARNIADLFNKTGIQQVSFDGLEGAWSTGLGQYGLNLMIKEWWDNLKPELRGNINDASMTTHYNWYIFTRMNWGEPWYAGFRESQMNYRLMNQDFYRRNLIPCMLGWFKYDANTSIEDVSWLLARSAAFDAGYTLVASPAAVEANGQSEQIIKAIREWEAARLSLAFPKELKLEMEHLNNEYTIEQLSDRSWKLFPYQTSRFEHKNIERQPGEPVVSRWNLDNRYDPSPMIFVIKANDNIENIKITIGGYSTIEIKEKLKKGEFLKYDGGDKITVTDKNWNPIGSIAVDADKLSIGKGKTVITFGCSFESKDSEMKVSAEIKTKGQPIELQAKRERR